MVNFPNSGEISQWKFSLLLFLIAAGLLGNYFNFPLFFNIDFLFGSIFALLALQFLGFVRGVLAAALIAGYTCFFWNHPYALIILTAEVALVGTVINRYRVSLVLADAMYWLLIGMPLVYLFYRGLMGTPSGSAYIVMIKQAVNGVANALLARLIFTSIAAARRSSLTPYREHIHNLLVLFALCPALVLLAVASRSDFKQADQAIRSDLHQSSLQMSQRLEVWIQNRTPAIVHLATMAATLTPQQMQGHLEQAHASDVNFQRVGLVDRAGITIAFSPLVDELEQSNVGRNFSDRPFIPALKQTLKPMLSEIMMGRLGAPTPIVTLLAPVSIQGQYGGFVSGILSLKQIDDYLQKSAEEATLLYTLLDKNQNVLLSNRKDQKVMSLFERGQGKLVRLDDSTSQWLPAPGTNTPLTELWRSSSYVAETPIGNLAEWRLILEQPVAPFQKLLNQRYADALTLLFLLLFAALAIGELLSRRITATTEQLSEITQALPAKLALGIQTDWPETTVLEQSRLVSHFKEMAEILANQFRENRELTASLEQKVDERTAKLKEGEQNLAITLNSIADAVITTDQRGHISGMNPTAQRLSGWSLPDAMGRPLGDIFRIIHAETRETIPDPVQLVMTRGQVSSLANHTLLLAKDGQQYQIADSAAPIRNAGGDIVGVVLVFSDVTERYRVQLALQISEQEYRSLLDNLSSGVVVHRPDTSILLFNPMACSLLGLTPEQMLGKTAVDPAWCFLHENGLPMPLEDYPVNRVIASGEPLKNYVVGVCQPGHNEPTWALCNAYPTRDKDGNLLQVVVTFADITERKKYEGQLLQIAHYDLLTQLPNRMLLADRLHQAMAQAQRRQQELAVVYLDLDGFKAINDHHGHDTGDQVLIALAKRMKEALRESDTMARIGGDEFVAVLTDLEDTSASVDLLNRLLAAAALPVQVGDLSLQISASLGVTFYPQAQDIEADQLFRQADQAMYQAKVAGKNRYCVFDAAQDSSIRHHHESLERMRRALERREFVLHYQPKVNMRSGKVIGVEALIRWQHPEKGLLMPAAFLPVIEDHPLAVDVGEWVMDSTMHQMQLWHTTGLDLPVSVNIGARQLQQGDFVVRLQAILAKHPQVQPGCIELEVLETSALNDMVQVSQVIDDCAGIGVKFALDDFGTGYSSLTYLKRLRVALLKIDQSFVRGMLGDPDDLAILQGIIGLASAFKRGVIAEGVETAAHGTALLQLGCELGQGYGIARPMPPDHLPAWVATWQPDAAWRGVMNGTALLTAIDQTRIVTSE